MPAGILCGEGGNRSRMGAMSHCRALYPPPQAHVGHGAGGDPNPQPRTKRGGRIPGSSGPRARTPRSLPSSRHCPPRATGPVPTGRGRGSRVGRRIPPAGWGPACGGIPGSMCPMLVGGERGSQPHECPLDLNRDAWGERDATHPGGIPGPTCPMGGSWPHPCWDPTRVLSRGAEGRGGFPSPTRPLGAFRQSPTSVRRAGVGARRGVSRSRAPWGRAPWSYERQPTIASPTRVP